MMFSIILPVYNREKGVKNAIESVLTQGNRTDWELIIIDDGSQDQSYTVCQEYAQKDTRIKVVHQDNKGVSGARNAGLRLAMGKYVLFLDSDDKLEKNALNILKETIERECVDIVVFGFQTKGKRWTPRIENKPRILGKEQIFEKVLPQQIMIENDTGWNLQPFVWNKCFRKELLMQEGVCFDETRRTWEDNLFCVHALKYAEAVVLIDHILYSFIPRQESDEQHLSDIIFPNMMEKYLAEDAEIAQLFSNLYNFDTDYVYERRYQNMMRLMQRAKKLGFWQYCAIVKFTFQNERAQRIILGVSPYGKRMHLEQFLIKRHLEFVTIIWYIVEYYRKGR